MTEKIVSLNINKVSMTKDVPSRIFDYLSMGLHSFI